MKSKSQGGQARRRTKWSVDAPSGEGPLEAGAPGSVTIHAKIDREDKDEVFSSERYPPFQLLPRKVCTKIMNKVLTLSLIACLAGLAGGICQ